MTDIYEIIKSVRVYEERNLFQIDYRTQKGVKLPAAKNDNRFRASTGVKSSKSILKSMEKKKFELAYKDYLSRMDTIENKDEILFKDIAYEALKEAEINRRDGSDSTKDYLNILENFVLDFFALMALNQIKPSDIKKWMQVISKRGISQARFNKYYYVLKRVLDYAAENSYIQNNPIQYVKRNSTKLFKKSKNKNKEYFTYEEREKILNYTCEGCTEKELQKHHFINTFMHVAFLTGARTGEIMALKWSDIDFDNMTMTIQRSIRKGKLAQTTKMSTSRTVPIIQRVSDSLLKYKNVKKGNSEYIFSVPNKGGLPYKNSRSISDTYLRKLLLKLNIPVRILYSTRATFSSLAAEKGVSMPVVSQSLGHTNISTTQRYYVRLGNMEQDNFRAELENLA